MTLAANLTGNWTAAVPGGYPVALSTAGETALEGAVPKGVAKVAIKVKSTTGVTADGAGATTANDATTATVYAALFSLPATSGGADGTEVTATRQTLSGLDAVEQTVTLTVPVADSTEVVPHLFRVWVATSGTNSVSVTAIQAS